MKSAWAWIKKWWWAVVAGIVGVVVLCLKAMRSNDRESNASLPATNTESLLELAKNEGHRAEAEILVEHEKKKVETAAEKKILEDIKNEPDLNTRRKRMARWATKNL